MTYGLVIQIRYTDGVIQIMTYTLNRYREDDVIQMIHSDDNIQINNTDDDIQMSHTDDDIQMMSY